MNKIRPVVGLPDVFPSEAFERSPKAKPWEKITSLNPNNEDEDDPVARELTRWLSILRYTDFTPSEIDLVGRLHHAVTEYPQRLFDRKKLIIEPHALLADLIAYMEEKEENDLALKEKKKLAFQEVPPNWLIQKTEQLLVREIGRKYTNDEVDRISQRVEELKFIFHHKEGLDPGPPIPIPPPVPFLTRKRKSKRLAFRKSVDTIYFHEAMNASRRMRLSRGDYEKSALEKTMIPFVRNA